LNLNTPQFVSRLIVSGAIPLLPLHVFMGWTGTAYGLSFTELQEQRYSLILFYILSTENIAQGVSPRKLTYKKHTHKHACRHKHIHTYIRTKVRNTYIHTYILTYIH